MKPVQERSIYIRYISGEMLPANAFNNGGLDIFSDYVYPEVLKEHCSRQLDFDGEIWYKKTRPIEIKSKEEVHLLRPPDTRKGRRQAEVEALDRALEQQRITAIREELANYGKNTTK